MAQIDRRVKKDGSLSYLIRVSCGYTREGRQVTRSLTYTPPAGLKGRKLEKEVQRQAQLFEDSVHSGALMPDMKFDEFLDRWFSEYAEKQLKPKTVYDYRRLAPRVSAALGSMKISKIRPAHILEFYSELEKGGRQDSTYSAKPALLDKLPRGQRTEIARRAGVGDETMRCVYRGKTVSRATAGKVAGAVGLSLSRAFTEHVRGNGKLKGDSVRHYHRFVSSVFERAVRWQIISENPCRRVEPPRAGEVDVQALDENQIAQLYAALHDAPAQFSVITQLALLTGARRGELCALRWSDIDLDAGTLSINRTVQRISGRGLIFNAPKTKRSRRCIKIGPDAVELLTEYRRFQMEERFKVGTAWARTIEIEGKQTQNDLLFTTCDGHPLDPDRITSWFPQFLQEHDLPAVHFHSLRHTNASLLIGSHVPVTTVSGRLGHARTSTTTDIYAGFIRTSDAAAADALTAVFDRIRAKEHA